MTLAPSILDISVISAKKGRIILSLTDKLVAGLDLIELTKLSTLSPLWT